MFKLHPVFHVCAVLALCGLVCGGWWFWTVDWYAAGPAVPPVLNTPIDESLCKVVALQLNETEFDPQDSEVVSVAREASLTISCTGECPPGIFRVKTPLIIRPGAGRSRTGYSNLLRASILVRVLRKSSHQPGYKVAAAAGAGAQIDSRYQLTWTGQLIAPTRAGEYLVQMTLVTADYPEQGAPQLTEYLLRSFILRVNE